VQKLWCQRISSTFGQCSRNVTLASALTQLQGEWTSHGNCCQNLTETVRFTRPHRFIIIAVRINAFSFQ
jgi:hypothetical protein